MLNRPHSKQFTSAPQIPVPPWRNRLARSAVNRKVGGSSPPGGDSFLNLDLHCKIGKPNRGKKFYWSIQPGFEPGIF